MAGALDIELVKKGHYRLGDQREKLSTQHIMRALKMHQSSIFLFSILVASPLIYLTSNLVEMVV
jgi:cobalamin biosynthesis protein CobD/CbiB